MFFFEILQALNFDWNKAIEVYCSLTDTQVVFINTMIKKKNKLRENEMNRYTNSSKGERVRKYV